MDQREHRLEIAKLVVTIVSVLIALVGGAIAYRDYSGKTAEHARDESSKARLQSLQAVQETQLATCNLVVEATAQLQAATTSTEFNKALAKFADLKHGRALFILDEAVLDEMIKVYNIAAKISSQPNADIATVSRHELCNKPFKIVLACRDMLRRGLRSEADSIPAISTNYPMEWLDCGPEQKGSKSSEKTVAPKR